jgi:PilZ domain-containing protein
MQRQLLNDDHELRRSKRFPIEAPLRYRISCDDDWKKAQTENISSTGVLFRCEQCAGQGAHVELNFLLLSSAGDQVGLEVACEGDVVRMDLPLGDRKLPALAVNITAYRLGPGTSGRWDLDASTRRSGTEE